MPVIFPLNLTQSPREILRVEGNLEGGGDGFPNTSRVLVEHGHSLIITREGLIDNFILHTSYCALISPSSGSFLIQAGTLTMLLYK